MELVALQKNARKLSGCLEKLETTNKTFARLCEHAHLKIEVSGDMSPVCVSVRVLSHAYWMRLRAQGNSEVASYSERKKDPNNSKKKIQFLVQRLSGTITLWTEDLERRKMVEMTFKRRGR